jgi:hypothetical protein
MRNGMFLETSNSFLQSKKIKLENQPLLNMYAWTKKIKGTNKNSRTCENIDNGKKSKTNATLRKQDSEEYLQINIKISLYKLGSEKVNRTKAVS